MTLSEKILFDSKVKFHISPKRMKEILRVEREMDGALSKKHKWSDEDEI